MKKLFFTAALAVVAIGGSLVSNANSRFSTQAGHLNTLEACEFETISDNCGVTNVTTQCTLSDSSPAYTNTAGPDGKCTQPLYRIF